VAKEEHDEEDPRNMQVPETEGEQAVEGLELESAAYRQTIKTRKVNIGMRENLKFTQIGDYWSDETVKKIANLLREYYDLFPTKFSEMKILLKLEAKSVGQSSYRLNPKYKEKVKAQIDRMFDAVIIKSTEVSEWISLMVVQDKKTGGIKICMDLRKLNDACLHDPFPTPFTDEVLENVGGQEIYSFTDDSRGII
jgi:hypothetical protein